MVAVTFSIPSNILLPSPLKAFIYEHSRQKVAAVAVEKKLYREKINRSSHSPGRKIFLKIERQKIMLYLQTQAK